MNTVLLLFTAMVVFVGVCVFVWSIVDTRRTYYKEYLERKKR